MLPLRKIAIVGKSEYSLNLKINTHRNDVQRTGGPPHDKHFKWQVKVSMFTLSLLSLRSFMTSHYQS